MITAKRIKPLEWRGSDFEGYQSFIINGVAVVGQSTDELWGIVLYRGWSGEDSIGEGFKSSEEGRVAAQEYHDNLILGALEV